MTWFNKEQGSNKIMQASHAVPLFSAFKVEGKWYARTLHGYSGAYDSEAEASDMAAFHKQSNEDLATREQYQRELYWALRTRVLTAEEMEAVQRYDYRLLIFNTQCYNEQEKRREFNDAMLQQFKLRLAAESKNTEDGKA